MKGVELYGQVRRAVYVEGLSRREAARRFGIDPRTVAKMLAFSVPPGYRRSGPPARPKLDAFIGIIDQIMEEDKGRPAKQRLELPRSRSRTHAAWRGTILDAWVNLAACRKSRRRVQIFPAPIPRPDFSKTAARPNIATRSPRSLERSGSDRPVVQGAEKVLRSHTERGKS